MPAAEFGGLSPVELRELEEAWEARVRREDYRAGVIAVLLASAHSERRHARWTLGDFFVSLRPTQDDPVEVKLARIFGGG